KYREAKRQLLAYAEETGDADAVSIAIAGCDSAIVWMAAPTVHRLRNEAGVNTSLSEFSAFPAGGDVYYAGEPDGAMRGMDRYGWTGNSFLRVYTAGRAGNNGLSDPVIATEDINNGAYHVGPVAAAPSGDTLYVTRTYAGKGGERSKEGHRRYRTNRL